MYWGAGIAPVAVMSYRLWRERYGSAPTILDFSRKQTRESVCEQLLQKPGDPSLETPRSELGTQPQRALLRTSGHLLDPVSTQRGCEPAGHAGAHPGQHLQPRVEH
jgi:hypothetical protein